VPSPRGFHSSVIIGDALIVWGGNCKGHVDDDRLYLLHLGVSSLVSRLRAHKPDSMLEIPMSG
jgi:hypothetical protein